MSVEDWKHDPSWPRDHNQRITGVYRLHGGRGTGVPLIWCEYGTWICGRNGCSEQHELSGDTHEERCAVAEVIMRMSPWHA